MATKHAQVCSIFITDNKEVHLNFLADNKDFFLIYSQFCCEIR